ncbi:MAG TPA: glycosyltransferase [Acidimicrobiales bacterium]|nr:glycosyltransferase [Acidimicrobiales bacterium]
MRALAVLSMHTSPLAQPGTGDGGGMNVYVRELATAVARAGVRCDVYTRAFSDELPAVVPVEPGLRVHHVAAGPLAPVAKEELPELVPEFTEAVLARMARGYDADALHANYWLSGVAGHAIKHERDVPLICTFHTLDRVKAEVDLGEDSARRSEAEAQVIGCSDAVLASCPEEVAQIARLYPAEPERIVIVPPAVDHAYFAPNPRDRRQPRRALGLPEDGRMLLFVGRIQPLKGVDVAVRALAALAESHPGAYLVIVGGPSGPGGDAEVRRISALIDELGLAGRVHLVPPRPHEQLSTYYRAADVCLVPSRTESFGLVALEAAACGTPVVASAVGGLRSLVDHGRTGFLVDGRDPAVFASYAGEVLDNAALARSMAGEAARQARDYTWTAAANALVRLYDVLTARELVSCP